LPLNRPQNQQPFIQPSQNHISALSPQLREQIQQHQLKQQLLKDQMQGKGSAIQVTPLYVNTDSRMPGNIYGKSILLMQIIFLVLSKLKDHKTTIVFLTFIRTSSNKSLITKFGFMYPDLF